MLDAAAAAAAAMSWWARCLAEVGKAMCRLLMDCRPRVFRLDAHSDGSVGIRCVRSKLNEIQQQAIQTVSETKTQTRKANLHRDSLILHS